MDEDEEVRESVAKNPNIPLGSLTALMADANEDIRKAAMENYKRRRDELRRES